MKKFIGLVLAIMLITTCAVGIAGCKPDDKPDGKTKFTESLDSMTLSNGYVEMTFVKENGSLTSFKNGVTKTDFINGSVGGNWAMMVDTSTGDCFESNPSGNSTVLVTSRKQKSTYSAQTNEDGVTLIINYDVSFESGSKKYTGITVKQTVTLDNDSDKAAFDYEITNGIDGVVITSFTGMQLSGLKNDAGDYKLFWPYKEGKIYDDAIKTVKTATDSSARMVAGYPVPFSMQLVQLYNDKESLFYYVEDDAREYKEFNFGSFINKGQHDFQGVEVADKVSLSCSQYPFAEKETKKLATTVIGVSDHGDYYTGSDHYREFLVSSGMTRSFSDFVKDWTGFSVLIGTQYGDKQFASYTQAEGFKDTYTNWAEKTNDYGVTSTTLIGWHAGGFDAMYPDYQFQTGAGFGENNFKAAMQLGHSNGNTFLAYLNLHIADKNSNWSNTVFNEATGVTNMLQCAIKTKGFTSNTAKDDYINYMIQESYGTGTYYYAMCPASEGFQTALTEAVVRLRKNGIDGLWLDQLMEMPANLCYDKSHGHKTPATAYGEGYAELFRQFELAMTENGTSDYILSAEGTCDAYIQYVDVCGYMWQRKLGARDTAGDGKNMVPEITRYTMPAKFLGIEGAGTANGDSDEFARAFVMSDPFLADPYKPSVGALTSIYAQNNVYLHGRYVDMKGTTCSDENIIYGLTVSDDGKYIAVNIYNYNTDKSSGTTIAIDFARLGLANAEVESATDMFTGDKVTFGGGVLTLPVLDELQIASVLIKLK